MMKQRYQNKDIYLQLKIQQIIDQYNLIMEYQKIVNWLDNTPDQLSKFRTKNWIEINDQ